MTTRDPGWICCAVERPLASKITSTGTLKPCDKVIAVSPADTSTIGAPSTLQPRCRSEAGVVMGVAA